MGLEEMGLRGALEGALDRCEAGNRTGKLSALGPSQSSQRLWITCCVQSPGTAAEDTR